MMLKANNTSANTTKYLMVVVSSLLLLTTLCLISTAVVDGNGEDVVVVPPNKVSLLRTVVHNVVESQTIQKVESIVKDVDEELVSFAKSIVGDNTHNGIEEVEEEDVDTNVSHRDHDHEESNVIIAVTKDLLHQQEEEGKHLAQDIANEFVHNPHLSLLPKKKNDDDENDMNVIRITTSDQFCGKIYDDTTKKVVLTTNVYCPQGDGITMIGTELDCAGYKIQGSNLRGSRGAATGSSSSQFGVMLRKNGQMSKTCIIRGFGLQRLGSATLYGGDGNNNGGGR